MVPAGQNPFHGIYASTVCPMRADHSLDEDAIARHAWDVMNGTGLVGVLCNGHAGENFVITGDEMRRVVEITVRAIGDRAIVVSGVNAESSLEAARQAATAERSGADAVMVFAPNSWLGGQDDEMALRHHVRVREAISLPIMLFQASVWAGKMAYAPSVLEKLLLIPGVVAVKEGSWEASAYERTLRIGQRVAPHVAIMGSGDEHLFTSYVVGSAGSIVSLADIVPQWIVSLDKAVRSGSLAEARRVHARIQPLANAIYGRAPGFRATARLKACLKLLGRIPSDTARPPIGPIPAEEITALQMALRQASLL